VLLITLDTTRADRIGCYGHEAAQTPTIDALASSGIRFEQAFCQVPLTLPSHASLLTGLCPPSNGVRINGGTALGGDVPTMAGLFKEHGYRTGAFIGASVLDSAFGLARGFDLYDDEIDDEADAEAEEVDLDVERTADRVCDAALAWLKESPSEAFFAWVHFFDPHAPYEPPPIFVGASGDLYDGEIALVDSQIRRLITWINDAGLDDRTMIILAGDHGEGLYDHRESQHGYFIYNSTMRVPLIFSSPSHFPQPQTIARSVRLVDVFPTVIELMGWEPLSDLDGRSLAHACLTGEAPSLPVYGESEYTLLAFGWAPLRSLIVDQWKFIDAPRSELYDWKSDPQELNNVIAAHGGVADSMRGNLQDLLSHMQSKMYAVERVALDAEAVERLAALGYVAGTSMPDSLDEDIERRDPKDMHPVFQRFTRALGMLADSNYDEVIRVLEPIIHRIPESGEVHSLLATAYLKLERFADAQRAYEASLRTIPPNRRRLFGLGEALRNQNKLEDAIPLYEEALVLSPDWDLPHHALATVYSQLQRYSEAEGHWRRCMELDPASTYYLTNLGTTLFAQRRPAEAIPLLQKALQNDPANEYAHRSLWQSLLGVGRRADAIGSLQAALQALPDAQRLRCPLAWLLVTTPGVASGDITNAIRWAKECCESEPSNARNFDALAAAYAAGGDFVRAAQTAREAIGLADKRGRVGLRRQIEARLRLYESGQPFVESASRGP
jgi:arylsulfatase A-like enzyme/Tfp pilus assembly protein PilF